jgi:catechol 2,3-dioxygenase-like lactoylglutathione lyase family enzyme
MPRREDALGVHSLDHFSLEVPDLDEARDFYLKFGLDIGADNNSLNIRTHGNSHVWGSLEEGRRKRLKYLSFGVFADDMEGFATALDRMGITRLDPPPWAQTDGIWLRDPDGTLLELRPAVKSSPEEKSAITTPTSPPGVRCAPLRDSADTVQPRRLQHVLVFTHHLQRSIEFYERVLGLRLSDSAGDVAFLHGVHGSDHHLIAFAESDGPGFHHCSWDVGSVHEVGQGAMQMADHGFGTGWGLGRHVLGSNYFHYVKDPWNSYSEYSSGMDYIPCDLDWQARTHRPENGFYLWGPAPPEGFATNFEIID